MNCKYSLLYLVGISAYFLAGSHVSESIIGGDKAEIEQFPYQASLLDYYNVNSCGGGIIGEHFILTAAHCILGGHGKWHGVYLFVLVGTSDLHKMDKPAMAREIEKMYVPKEYDPASKRRLGDIAVLKLKHSLELSKNEHLKALKFPEDNNETYAGKTARIAGFGWHWVVTENNREIGGINDTYLHFAEAEVFDECHDKFIQDSDSDKRICAGMKHRDHSKPRGVCIGDSGSPLVYDETVIGILSISLVNCSEKDVGALYTRVSHYTQFIKDAMKYEHVKHHKHIREFDFHH